MKFTWKENWLTAAASQVSTSNSNLELLLTPFKGECTTSVPVVAVDTKKEDVVVRLVIGSRDFDQELLVNPRQPYLRIADTARGLSMAQQSIPFGANPAEYAEKQSV